MNPHIIRIRPDGPFDHTTRGSSTWRGIKKVAQVAPSSLTHQIGIVSRRANADGFGGTAEEVAHVVREVLEGVGGILEGGLDLGATEDLVEDGVVVGGTGGALDGGVGLEEEVPVAGFGDAAVDDGAVLRVRGPVGVFLLDGVEARVVPLADDDDGHAG